MDGKSIEIRDLRQECNRELLDSFVILYDRTFVVPEEREDPASWGTRLSTSPSPPQPLMHLLVATPPTSSSVSPQVLGGLAFEYYRISRCGLLTYLVVEPDYRKQGIARALVNRALRILRNDAKHEGQRLLAIFSETEDPTKVSIVESAIHSQDRGTVFARLGAKRIALPYVQPKLFGSPNRARHLMLLSFTQECKLTGYIPGWVLAGFLKEFYQALGSKKPEADPDYQLMNRYLQSDVVLEDLPLCE